MFNFKDMRPCWEIGQNFHSREDLKKLGCSDQLISWLTPADGRWMMLVEPEEWFWRDRDWFPPKDRPFVQELHEISGGTFCAMSLEEQCDFLDIPFVTINGQKTKGARGKWEGRAGPVNVEAFALEHFEDQGATGFAFEGAGFAAWLYPMNDFYRAMFKRIPGYDRVNGEHVRSSPSAEGANEYLQALRKAREKLDQVLVARPDRYARLWPPVTRETLGTFTELVGWDLIEKLHDLQFRLGATVVNGWPDLTLKQDGKLRFVEVKSNDRLRGNQAKWVRDIARPLGLDVSVVRVTAS